VLFIGNSLTYTNDLPGIVEAMARSDGEMEIDAGEVAFPNFSLQDHWNEGTAREELEGAEWDFVIMQQGPSSLPENQEMLREWTVKWAEVIRDHGAEPALFTVWPSADRSFAFPDVISAYATAADGVDGVLLPAGEAWVAAWDEDGSLQFYGPDQFHPSQLGSYTAAAVIFGGLLDRSPVGLPASLRIDDDFVIDLPSATARLVQRAANDVLSARK
jgi:hypothetical protein